MLALQNTEPSSGNDHLMERGLEIGKAFAASSSLLELTLRKIGGRYGSSFNRQREVYPMAIESSSHERHP